MSEYENSPTVGAASDAVSNTSTFAALLQDENALLPSSMNSIVTECTKETLDSYDLDDPPERGVIERNLLASINLAIDMRNTMHKGVSKWRALTHLPAAALAECIAWYGDVAVVELVEGKSESCVVAVYDESRGIYTTDNRYIRRVVSLWDRSISERAVSEVLKCLERDFVCDGNVKPVCRDPRYTCVANGVYDHHEHVLLPHSRERVFLSRIEIDYDPSAENPVIADDGIPWDIESAFLEWAGNDADVCTLLWQGGVQAVRPNLRFHSMLGFVGASGCNGKGTICAFYRHLVGGNAVSYNLKDMAKEHAMGGVENCNAIIADENPVGNYLESSDRVKCIITGDEFLINPKYEHEYMATFHGLVVQCLNDIPRIRDRTDSFYRRLRFIEFKTSYVGCERKQIKHDYIRRPEVLRYALKKCLEMEVDEINPTYVYPDACKAVMGTFKLLNNPVREFAFDVLPRATWPLLPKEFLWDLYKAWSKLNAPSGSPLSRLRFYEEFTALIESEPSLGFAPTNASVSSAPIHGVAEPLIGEFGLDYLGSKWSCGNPADPGMRRDVPTDLAVKYRGYMRVAPSVVDVADVVAM